MDLIKKSNRLAALANYLINHSNQQSTQFLLAFDAINILGNKTYEEFQVLYLGDLFVYDLPVVFPNDWQSCGEFLPPELKAGEDGHILPGQIGIYLGINLIEFRWLFEYTEELDEATNRKVLGERILNFIEKNYEI